MILEHGNALIFQRNLLLRTIKARLSVRQISSLLISKEKLRDSIFARLRQLLLSIGPFLPASLAERPRGHEKKTVSSYRTIYHLLPLQHSEMPPDRTGWRVDHVSRLR